MKGYQICVNCFDGVVKQNGSYWCKKRRTCLTNIQNAIGSNNKASIEYGVIVLTSNAENGVNNV